MRSVYKTKPGDTLWKISIKNNIEFEDIEKDVDIKCLKLNKGQGLLLPFAKNKKVELCHYVTLEEETLNDITEKSETDFDEIAYFNNISHLILAKDQIINIGT